MKEKEAQHNNTVHFMIGFLLVAAAGTALLDPRLKADKHELTGALVAIENKLDTQMIRCSSDTGCPGNSYCAEGYCVADAPNDGVPPANRATGAVVGLNYAPKKKLMECESNFDCPQSAVCKEGYCFLQIKS